MANPVRVEDLQRQMAAMQQQLQALAVRPQVDNLLIRADRARALAAENRAELIARYQPYLIGRTTLTATKVVGKAAFAVATKKTAEQAAKKRIAKWIPGVSLVCGVSLAVTRYTKGESWKKIAGELASGAAGCFPGAGIAISLLIDGTLIYVDYRDYDPAAGAVAEQNIAIATIQEAYQCLGIEVADPTREEVDRAYRTLSQQLHPDRMGVFGNEIQLDFQRMQIILNRARDLIYENRGWR